MGRVITATIASTLVFVLGLLYFRNTNSNPEPQVIEAPTYSKNVREVFGRRCQACHNAGWPEANWMDYSTAFSKASVISKRVVERTMPPGNFIPKGEVELIKTWVDQGARE